MKSVLQAYWLLTVAVGSVVVIIVAEAELFDMQWKEFIFFAGLVVTTSFIFKFMTRNYVEKDQYSKLGGDESPLLSSSSGKGGGSGAAAGGGAGGVLSG